MLNKLPLEGLATLLIVTGFLVATFQVPENTNSRPSYPADSGGDVPIKEACYDEMPKNAWTHRQFSENKTKVEATIYVDTCELDDLGAGPQDVKNFIVHEQAHAKKGMAARRRNAGNERCLLPQCKNHR